MATYTINEFKKSSAKRNGHSFSILARKLPGESQSDFDTRWAQASSRLNRIVNAMPFVPRPFRPSGLSGRGRSPIPGEASHHPAEKYIQGQNQYLLSLPLEVREMIYSYTLSTNSGVLTTAESDHTLTKSRTKRWYRDTRGLLETSSLIRKEALPLLYKYNIFEVYIGDKNERRDFFRFLQDFVGVENAQKLKRLRFAKRYTHAGGGRMVEVDVRARGKQICKILHEASVFKDRENEEAEWVEVKGSQIEISDMGAVLSAKAAMGHLGRVYDMMAVSMGVL